MDPDLQPLIELARVGQRAGIEAIYRRTAPDVISFTWAMLDNEEQALQAAEKTFRQALRAREDIRDAHELPLWLHSIAMDHCRDAIRATPSRAMRHQTSLTPQQQLDVLDPEARAAALLSAAGFSDEQIATVAKAKPDPAAVEAAKLVGRRSPPMSLWASLDRTLSAQRAMKPRDTMRRRVAPSWLWIALAATAAIVVLALLIYWGRPGRGVLEGRVTDAATGEPLSGCTVRVQPVGIHMEEIYEGDAEVGARQAVTGADGRFSFAGLREGRYLIDADTDAYVPHRLAARTWIHPEIREQIARTMEVSREVLERYVEANPQTTDHLPLVFRGRATAVELRLRRISRHRDLPPGTPDEARRTYEIIDRLTALLHRYDAENGGDYPPSGILKLGRALNRPDLLDGHGAIVDGWGRPMVYRNNAPDYPKNLSDSTARNKTSFDIYSFGPDGKDDNGDGDDMGNWQKDER